VTQYTQMLAESRHVAVMRMCQTAQGMGEVAAYGAAVIVKQPDKPQDSETDASTG
jgi:uncharacterized protein YbjQ (UPF0145 family)